MPDQCSAPPADRHEPGPISVVGGMDPTGGAGILRDQWVIQSLLPQVQLQICCSALTEQGRGRPARLLAGPGSGWARRLQALTGRVWKIGWLPPGSVEALVERLHELSSEGERRVVLDPVAKASAGGLVRADPKELVRLWPHCEWVTPNASEARGLGATPTIKGPYKIPPSLKGPNWWIKSVHQDHDAIEDELHVQGQVLRVRRPLVLGPDPRGTGCALSSALACHLAREREGLQGGEAASNLEGLQGGEDHLDREGLQAGDAVSNRAGLQGGEAASNPWVVKAWRGCAWHRMSDESTLPCLDAVLASMDWLDRARAQLVRGPGGAWHLPVHRGTRGAKRRG